MSGATIGMIVRARPRPGVVREVASFYADGAATLGMKSNMGGILAMIESGAPGRSSTGRNHVEDAALDRSDRNQADAMRRVYGALSAIDQGHRDVLFVAYGLPESEWPPSARSALGVACGVALLTARAATARERAAARGATKAADGRAELATYLARLCAEGNEAERDGVQREAEAMLQDALDAYWLAAVECSTPAAKGEARRETARRANEHEARSEAAKAREAERAERRAQTVAATYDPEAT